MILITGITRYLNPICMEQSPTDIPDIGIKTNKSSIRVRSNLPAINDPTDRNQKVKEKGGKIDTDGNGNWLTYNQKLFADEWLRDRNATRAYKAAYPNTIKDSAASSSGSSLLRSLKIDRYIQRKLKAIAKKATIDVEWVLKRYKMLADYSIDDFFYDSGEMKPFSEIPKEALYAVGGFKQSKKTITTKDEAIITDRIKEFKLPSKRMVLDSIGKHLGMFARDDDNNQKGGISIDKAVINIKFVD